MKLLIMCEGPNEKAVIDLLLDADRLTFSRDDLLNLTPFHARQINSSAAVKTALNLYPGEVKVLRVGDSMTDRLVIPKEYRGKIVGEEKYCTKPELEMLLIIAEGLAGEFEKVKSGKKRTSPKSFSKEHIIYNHTRYDNSTQFYVDYFGSDIDKLVAAIKTYRQTKGSHKKDEGYLADLLK